MSSSAPAPKKRDFIAIANQYASDVLSGAIPACKEVKAAIQRQVDDLKKEDFAYTFDEKKGEKICRFVELCPHIEGRKFAGKRLTLEPWQVWLLVTIFSWVDRDNPTIRRFKRNYVEVPKGNGKSFLVSALAIYLAFADGEPGSQVYTAATSMPQARITFGVSQKMLRAMESFRTKAGIEVEAHAIVQRGSNSFYRPLSSEAKAVEGTNPYAFFIDELHIAADRELLDNAETACGKREGSLLWAITTAGSDRAGVCYEWHQYLKAILSGKPVDDTFFGIIYTIDEEDDWTLPANWKKANPNWGVSVIPAEIAAKCSKAMEQASAQGTFKTKHLNIWVGASACWMDMQRFNKCADAELSEEEFIGQPCVLGLDLASKLDLLALTKVFWKEIDGKTHYYAFGRYWTNEARIEDSSNSQYRGWQIEGWLQVCDGETNDYGIVEDYLHAESARFEVLEVCHDPWQAHDTMTRVSQDGINVVQVPQMPKYLSDPMKEIEAAVYDGRFHFNGDPVLVWAMGNVICKPDKNDNLFPAKERPENKIDPATSLMTAFNGVSRYAGSSSTSGVSAIGECQRCKALCIGKMDEKGTISFYCEGCLCA
jgi:phage terminase large subunit-like protein